MAQNISRRKPLFGNKRSHALNAKRHKQGLNLQVVRLEDGTKVRLTAKENKTLNKQNKTVE